MSTFLKRLAALLAIGMLLGCAPAPLSELNCVTVDGIQVCSPFYEHYETWGGRAVLGRPVSGVVMEKGRRVQYFETVCMEVDSFTGEVTLTNLGDQLGLRTKPLDPRTVALRKEKGAVYFTETGHSLCPAFDGYYQDLGGVELLGCPIAEFDVEGDLIVQCFERAKLEWNPQNGLGAVRLAKLGEELWRLRQAKQSLPVGTRNALGEIQTTSVAEGAEQPPQQGYVPEPTDVPLPVKIDLSLAADVLACPGQQTVVLRVLDASGAGVPGLPSTVIVHERNSDRVLHLDITDDHGFAAQSYDLDPNSRGLRVVVRAEVSYHEQTYATVGSYVVW